MKKRVLVTGGAGFVGSHLCEKLLANGDEVIAVDNYYTGSRKNLAHLSNLTIVDHDVCIPIRLEVDEIYHLASPASPKDYQKDPIETIKINVIGSLNMLELARVQNAKFLQASTSEIYGDPLKHPQDEKYFGNVNCTGIRACYDESKRCAETLCFDFARKYNMDIKVVRIFNTYGPRMQIDDGRVVSNFIVQALKNEPITVYGEGLQTRSFCYVDDLVDGFILAMGKKDISPINLGNDGEFTVLDLAKIVLRLTKSGSKIVYEKMPDDDPKLRRPDLSKAKKLLNWYPKIRLEEGLIKTIDYFRKVLN